MEHLIFIVRWFLGKVIALQTFFRSRPRLDVDIQLDPEMLYGRRSNGYSIKQFHDNPVPINLAKMDFTFQWHFLIRIKNNSTKTAYNLRIESFQLGSKDYVEKLDPLASLKEGEVISLKYIVRHEASYTGAEAETFLAPFPKHIDKIELLISYTNEARTKFYTHSELSSTSRRSENLVCKPRKQ